VTIFKNSKCILIFFIYLLTLIPVRGVFAATCNDQADGNWNSAATWSCGIVPDADDDVTIDSHAVTITADAESLSTNISGGTLVQNASIIFTVGSGDFLQTGGTMNLNASVMKVFGDFTHSAGTFNAGTSIISLAGKDQIIAGSTTFYKLYKLVNDNDTLTIGNGTNLTIDTGGIMRLKGGDGVSDKLALRSSLDGSSYTITTTGGIAMENLDIKDLALSVTNSASSSLDSGGNTNLVVTKEFISTIKSSGGDYTTLSAWEDAVETDLTAVTTKVFSHGGITGTIADGATVTGATSTATAIVLHATATQILVQSIATSTFQSGEQMQVDGSNYVTLGDAGFGAIATAECYNDWAGGLSDQVIIDDWTTDADNYVKIYTPKSERHNGVKNSGFTLIGSTNPIIGSFESYTKIRGIAVNGDNSDNGSGVTASGTYSEISNCLVYDFGSNHSGGLITGGYSKVFNNLVFNVLGDDSAMSIGASAQPSYVYSNTVINSRNGIYVSDHSGSIGKNNLSTGNITTDYAGDLSKSSCVSSDSTAGYTNGNLSEQKIDFASRLEDDYHLSIDDIAANNRGLDLSVDADYPIIGDIDGDRRVYDEILNEKWDIGADQSSIGFVSKIRASGGDYSTLTSWETANQVDLTADGTLVFSHIEGLKDGIISDGITVVGETSGATATAVHVSEGQILLSSITLSGSDANFAFLPGEKVYISGGVTTSDYIILSNNPPSTASSVAECYNDWPSGLADALSIDGWTTDPHRYPKVYAPEGQRHTGKPLDEGNYTGFALIEDMHWTSTISVVEGGTRISGILIDELNFSSVGINISSSDYYSYNSENIVFTTVSSGVSTGFRSTNNGKALHSNNIAQGLQHGFYLSSWRKSYVYNNVAFDCNSDGFHRHDGMDAHLLKNNIAVENGIDFQGTFDSGSSNNISSDLTVPGSNSINSATLTDLDFKDTTSGTEDLHLGPDSIARGVATEIEDFSLDIDGQPRDIDASGWDVGPDEALPDSISKIREALQTDVDFSTLSSWEAAIDSDLTADSSMIFPVSSTETFDSSTDLDQAVTFASGATGTLKMLNSSNVAYMTGISGTVERGLVTIDSTSHVFSISNEGEKVGRAVAECYNDWGVSGLSDRLILDDWGVSSDHYVKVYAPKGQRHIGVAGTGFHLNANYSYGIITAAYTEIDGIELSGWGWNDKVRSGIDASYYNTIRNNIVHDPDDDTASKYIGIEANEYCEIYNNIVYNIDKPSAGDGVGITGFRNNIFYNNTVYNSRRGIVRTEDDQDDIFINNLSFGNSVSDYYITAVATSPSSSKNISSDGTANGTNPMINVTLAQISFKNVTAGSEDLHISNSSVAVSAGSNEVFSLVDHDIDGDLRLSVSMDIGADQVGTSVYRSVGPGNVNVLQDGIGTGISNNMTISGTTATFDSDIDDKIGVGDAIQYDSDDDGTVDSIAFIHSRGSSTSYTLKNVEGLTPTPTSVADSDWGIFRAYTSFANAEKGNENDGIDDSLENFDDWTVGGEKDDDEIGKDLTSSNQIWLVACYGDAMDSQSTGVIVDGWTTSSDQYLKFFTPVSSNEVGESQRHEGVWDSEVYTLTTSVPQDGIRLTIKDSFVILDGLQLLGKSDSTYGNILQVENADASAVVQVKNTLFKKSFQHAAYLGSANTGKLIISNSVALSCAQGFVGDSENLDEVQLYNVTVVKSSNYAANSNYGARYLLAKNVVALNYGGSSGYRNFLGLHADSTNCVANNEDMSGITDSFETTQTTSQFFQDSENDDYHLKEISEAIGKGINLGSDYALDVDREVRTRWDVGADEMFKPNYEVRGNVQFRGNVKMR